MEVYENISLLLKEEKITKKEFAEKLICLEPKLKSTGNVPSIKTVYGYLAGRISISIELIPYIAEVLRVTEQELFFTSYDKRINFYKKMVSNATPEEISMIKEKINIKETFQDILQEDDVQNIINPLINKLEDLKSYIENR